MPALCPTRANAYEPAMMNDSAPLLRRTADGLDRLAIGDRFGLSLGFHAMDQQG